MPSGESCFSKLQSVKTNTQNFRFSTLSGSLVNRRIDPLAKWRGVVIRSKIQRSNDVTPFYITEILLGLLHDTKDQSHRQLDCRDKRDVSLNESTTCHRE